MIIVTHNGPFHSDEVTATVILKRIYPEAEIIRTRNQDIIAKADIVYDVGMEYDGETKFDHHQPEKQLREDGTPYSSCGLIWRKFGLIFISKVAPWLTKSDIERIHRRIDSQIVYGIDATDNGISRGTTYDISSMISVKNPTVGSAISIEDAFHETVNWVSEILMERLESEFEIVRSRVIVEEAFNNRDHSQLLILPEYRDWTTTLLSLDINNEVLYTIYPDSFSEGYRITTVPAKSGDYAARKPLPEDWAGKTPEELNAMIGIPDAVFCHTARFIAGTGSKESIMKAAELAING